jgi:thiamine biosynthesis lipoprotein
MSTWRDDSELSAVRRGPGPVSVSEETAFVVREALGVAKASGGAFDPTVQPLVELWGFPGAPRTTMPSDQELSAARSQVGWAKVKVSEEAGQWTVDGGGTALDLSAIAKGHAVDRVSDALTGLGLTNHLVEVGGEVRGSGGGTTGFGWRVGVDHPDASSAPGSSLEAVIRLENLAMATSGNYRSAYVVEGETLGHTLDPRSGRPVTSDVLSATVVATDCRTADALATTLMVDPKWGMQLVKNRPDTEALLLERIGDELARRQTPGMYALHSKLGGPKGD